MQPERLVCSLLSALASMIVGGGCMAFAEPPAVEPPAAGPPAAGPPAAGPPAAGLPAAMVDRLKSEEFSRRETAEAELLAWARDQPEGAVDELYRQSRSAEDPEVRARCLSVLKGVVLDGYLRDGPGYMGIRMGPFTEMAMVPDQANRPFGFRIIQVEPDTPAQGVGLLAGDLILSVDETNWQQGQTSEAFIAKVKAMKSGTRVVLKIFRGGKILEVPLVLARRPAAADLMLFGMMRLNPEDVAAAEEAAKDAYFQTWLADRKAKE